MAQRTTSSGSMPAARGTTRPSLAEASQQTPDDMTPIDPPRLVNELGHEEETTGARPSGAKNRRRGGASPSIPGAVLPVPVVVAAAVRVPVPPRRSLAGTRLGLQLCQLLARRRQLVGLTIPQVGSLSGIPNSEVEAYEAGGKVPYDHVVVLARVLGIPFADLPGYRADAGTPVQQAVRAAAHTLAEPLRLLYRLDGGEDVFGGPVDTLTGINEFVVELADQSLSANFPQGTVLAFTRPRGPSGGDLVVALHKASSMLVLRQVRGSLLAGIVAEQPSYQLDRAWTLLGRLALSLYPTTEPSSR